MKEQLINVNHNEEEFNKNLITKILTLNDLGIYLRFRYQDYRTAGKLAGISETRVRQILIGYCLPKSSKLINQIARGWQIDPVKLTILFEKERGKND